MVFSLATRRRSGCAVTLVGVADESSDGSIESQSTCLPGCRNSLALLAFRFEVPIGSADLATGGG